MIIRRQPCQRAEASMAARLVVSFKLVKSRRQPCQRAEASMAARLVVERKKKQIENCHVRIFSLHFRYMLSFILDLKCCLLHRHHLGKPFLNFLILHNSFLSFYLLLRCKGSNFSFCSYRYLCRIYLR